MRNFTALVLVAALPRIAAVLVSDSTPTQPSCHDVTPETKAYFQQNATEQMSDAQLSHGHWVASSHTYHGQQIIYYSFAVNGGEHIATWAQNGRDPTRSIQVAVKGSFADELSILGTAGSPPIGRLSWPGAKESQECVQSALKDDEADDALGQMDSSDSRTLTVVTTNDRARLCPRPNCGSGEQLARVPTGTTLPILGSRPVSSGMQEIRWYRVRLEGDEGWLSEFDVNADSP